MNQSELVDKVAQKTTLTQGSLSGAHRPVEPGGVSEGCFDLR
jgi:hypothetical protein